MIDELCIISNTPMRARKSDIKKFTET